MADRLMPTFGMLGTWRFLLALLVVNGHMGKPWWPAGYAVFSFYLLSGFFTTLVLHEKYGFDAPGLRRFAAGRLRRIYPPYFLACVVSVVLLLLLPTESIRPMSAVLRFPSTGTEVFSNLTLLGLEISTPARLVPPAWALGIEVVFYTILALAFARNPSWAFLGLALAVAYPIGLWLFSTYAWIDRYFTIEGAALPFSVGCVLYHQREAVGGFVRRLGALALPIAASIYAAVFLVPAFGLVHPTGHFFYLSVAGAAALFATLWHLPAASPPAAARVDAWLGQVSYPVFLLHWQVATLLVAVVGLQRKSPPIVAATMLLSILAGAVVVELEEAHRRRSKRRLPGQR